MKKIVFILAVAVMAVMGTSCSNKAEKIAKQYQAAVNAGDSTAVVQLYPFVNDEGKQVEMSYYAPIAIEGGMNVEKIDDNNFKVTYQGTVIDSLNKEFWFETFNADNPTRVLYITKQEDGTYKITDSENIMMWNMGWNFVYNKTGYAEAKNIKTDVQYYKDEYPDEFSDYLWENYRDAGNCNLHCNNYSWNGNKKYPNRLDFIFYYKNVGDRFEPEVSSKVDEKIIARSTARDKSGNELATAQEELYTPIEAGQSGSQTLTFYFPNVLRRFHRAYVYFHYVRNGHEYTTFEQYAKYAKFTGNEYNDFLSKQ